MKLKFKNIGLWIPHAFILLKKNKKQSRSFSNIKNRIWILNHVFFFLFSDPSRLEYYILFKPTLANTVFLRLETQNIFTYFYNIHKLWGVAFHFSFEINFPLSPLSILFPHLFPFFPNFLPYSSFISYNSAF